MTATASPTAPPPVRVRPLAAAEAGFLAAVCYVPMLLGARGRLNADTKQYLYLDPWDLLHRALSLWDTSVGGGAVTHQTVGYLWPMGPFYALGDLLRLPDWVTQRLWIGSIQMFAAVGALVLFRTLMPRKHPAQLVAALGYGLSPFVLGHVTGQSALLLPFSAFGWLVWTLVRGLDEGTWRWPAGFALIVTTCGSLNGTSVFFVILGAVIWVPFGVHTLGRASARGGIVLLARAGALTVLTQLWWMVAYSIDGHYGLPILSVTETVQATSSTTSAAEILRGLGYWFFYGGDGHRLWLAGLATPYMTSPALLLVSFSVPVLALVLASRLRWSSRAYFAALITVGTLIATISFSSPHRSPAGVAFEAASRKVDLVLSLRNTERAGPLVALGLMGLLSASLTALWARHPRRALVTAAALVVGIGLSMPSEWRDGLIAARFHRDAIPSTWVAAGKALDEGSGTVLELPGSDFAAYRWGNTLDPVSVGLTKRPVIARELVPQGGPVGVSILNALDRSFQEGWYEPAAVAPAARLLGASTVLARNDLEYERYRIIRPPRLWDALTDPASGLGTPTSIGPPTVNQAAPDQPLVDEAQLALSLDAPPPPPIGLFPVPGGDRPELSTQAPAEPTIVDGSGEGLLNAGAAGLLDHQKGPLLLGADLARSGTDPRLLGPSPRWIITDSNRKQDERWYTLRENVGATEPADGYVSTDEATETVGGRIDLVPNMPATSQSVVRWEGARRVWASAYGEASTLLPEDRPSNAFDGDPTTAWRVDSATVPGPYRVGIDLGREVHPDHVDLVQPQGRPGSQRVTSAVVVLDSTRRFTVHLAASHAFDAAGVRVPLDGRPFHSLEVDLTGFAPPFGPVGLAEVEIPGVKVTELVQPPTAMLATLGSTLGTSPVAMVLSRLRADPSEPVRADPEPAIQRRLVLPSPAALALSGTARLRPNGDDAATDRLAGTTGPVVRSSQYLPGDLGARASAALDGRTGTAWSTPFVGLVHQWWEATTQKRTTVSSLALDLVVDAHHSAPTRIGVTVDGGAEQVVPVPPLTPGALGTTRRVELVLPRPAVGRSVRLTIEGAKARTTTDWYSGNPVALPIAIAEVHLPGVTPTVAGAKVDTGCRDDLLRIDGAPVPLRITGSAPGALARGGLAITTCSGAPLTLSAGPHDLMATAGTTTGLDLDRFVLETPAWSVAARAPVPTSPRVTVTSSGRGRAKGSLQSDGSPFWLVLDQSASAGWHLDAHGPGGAATVDGPHPVDGNAVGWLVRPKAAGLVQLHATWTPQRPVDLALVASLLASVACLVLVALGWRRRRAQGPAPTEPAPFGPPRLAAGAKVDWRRSLPGAVATAIVAGLCISPVAAVPSGVAMALFTSRPRWGRFLPPALVALAAASVVLLQVRDRVPAGPGWPARFGFAHLVTLMAILLLGMEAIAEATRHRKARRRREERAAELARRRVERGVPSRRRGRRPSSGGAEPGAVGDH